MSSAGTPAKKAKVELTARDVELLAFAMQSMKDPNVQIDYEKFAALAGMTNGSARVTWGKIRRKLTAASGQAADTPASAKSQAATKSKAKRVRKRKADEEADADGDENDEAGTPESPTTLVAERRQKAKKVKEEAGAEAEATQEASVKVKADAV